MSGNNFETSKKCGRGGKEEDKNGLSFLRSHTKDKLLQEQDQLIRLDELLDEAEDSDENKN